MKSLKSVFRYFSDRFRQLLPELRLIAVSIIIGGICGVIGTAFHAAVEYATELRLLNPWMLFLLPAAGLMIAAVYKLTGMESIGTNAILEEVQSGKYISVLLIPAIFIGTVLTHLCGGSSGREGAALQIGGSMGCNVGKVFRLSDHECRTATLCGMAALFSALFGTPLAAALFSMTVIHVGVVFYSAFVPCLAASLSAYGISLALGVAPTRFAVAVPAESWLIYIRVAALAAIAALAVIIFCRSLHYLEGCAKKRLPNVWLRAAVGGSLIVILSLIFKDGRYNGAGMNIITEAVSFGQAMPWDWLLKIVFTCITISAGFRGGEVVPCFFIGASLGCVLGPALGLPAGFAASIGLVAVFCGATNCVTASIFLAMELFGGQGLLCYALACGISYTLSGYHGLYSSQMMLTSKLTPEYFIKDRPNSTH